MRNLEERSIRLLSEYIDRRIKEGASQEEMDKLYDELNDLKTNHVIGELLNE